MLVISVRQVVLALLVIISPLAIVCALLPNTAKWFQKWLKAYVQMLAVYPMFMLAWAGVRGLQSIGITNMMVSDDTVAKIFGWLMGLVLPILPVFLILPLLKMGGGLMSKITDKVQGGVTKSPLGTMFANEDKRRQRNALWNGRNPISSIGRKIAGRAALVDETIDNNKNTVLSNYKNTQMAKSTAKGVITRGRNKGLYRGRGGRHINANAQAANAQTAYGNAMQNAIGQNVRLNFETNTAEVEKELSDIAKKERKANFRADPQAGEGLQKKLEIAQGKAEIAESRLGANTMRRARDSNSDLGKLTREKMAYDQQKNLWQKDVNQNYAKEINKNAGDNDLAKIASGNKGDPALFDKEGKLRHTLAMASATGTISKADDEEVTAHQSLLKGRLKELRASNMSDRDALTQLRNGVDKDDENAMEAAYKLFEGDRLLLIRLH
jgi:hypothetical protein